MSKHNTILLTFAVPAAATIFCTCSAWHRSSLPLSTIQLLGGKSSGHLQAQAQKAITQTNTNTAACSTSGVQLYIS
jgi:hypothetical protein